jgi:hypothetical protein
MKQNIVARCGSSIATPFAIPPIVTGRPLTSTRRHADHTRGGDQHVLRRDLEELAREPRHLARVAEALLARADVRASAVGDDCLRDAAAQVLHRHEHGRALHLVRREDGGGARRGRGVDEREVLTPARLDARRHAAGEDAGHRGDAAVEPLDIGHYG